MAPNAPRWQFRRMGKDDMNINPIECEFFPTEALDYCRKATRFNLENGKKPWRYVLIPHEAVQFNMSFNGLAMKYGIELEHGGQALTLTEFYSESMFPFREHIY
jgi:hypothetical protein